MPQKRGRKPIADQKTLALWARAYRNGSTLSDIAAGAGVSIQTVSMSLRKLGVTPGKRGRPPGRPGKKQPIERSKYARYLTRWIGMYRDGASVNQIARKYKLHPYSVQYALGRAGLNLRGSRRTKVTAAMVQQWIEMYRDGIASPAIAVRFGVNETTVRRRIKRAGIRLRIAGAAGAAPPPRTEAPYTQAASRA